MDTVCPVKHMGSIWLYDVYTVDNLKGKAQVVPAGLAYGSEHKYVAEGDDGQRNEENKAAEHHSVAPVGQRVRHIVPGAGGHQAFWDVRAYKQSEVCQILGVTVKMPSHIRFRLKEGITSQQSHVVCLQQCIWGQMESLIQKGYFLLCSFLTNRFLMSGLKQWS